MRMESAYCVDTTGKETCSGGGGHYVYWMSVDNPDVLRVYVNNVLVADGLSGGGGEFLITELGVERIE